MSFEFETNEPNEKSKKKLINKKKHRKKIYYNSKRLFW